MALSLNVLLGYVGQISLGHAAFVGIGAFTSAYLVTVQGQSFWVGVARRHRHRRPARRSSSGACRCGSPACTSPSSRCPTAWSPSRTSSRSRSSPAAGPASAAPKPAWFDTEWRYYYLCLAFLAVVLFVDWRMMRTKGGRALLALRENPRVAATFGINVRLATLLAFGVSGAFAGLAGALIAHGDESVSADAWSFRLSLVFVIDDGGRRAAVSRAGLVIGWAFFALLPLPDREDPRLRGPARQGARGRST